MLQQQLAMTPQDQAVQLKYSHTLMVVKQQKLNVMMVFKAKKPPVFLSVLLDLLDLDQIKDLSLLDLDQIKDLSLLEVVGVNGVNGVLLDLLWIKSKTCRRLFWIWIK